MGLMGLRLRVSTEGSCSSCSSTAAKTVERWLAVRARRWLACRPSGCLSRSPARRPAAGASAQRRLLRDTCDTVSARLRQLAASEL